jgi:hypothetical protein|tara:strand:- start:140 stop:1015 length:876 start_codon:yes stop_codon:yes gene_type:complete
MAIQYSLNYDDQGNPSLVKNTITGSRKVIDTSRFTIGAYLPARTISTDYNFTATPTEDSREVFGTQTQYEILETFIKENDGGDGNTKDITPTGKDYSLSVTQQAKVNALKAAGMYKEADDFKNYSLNKAKADDLKSFTGTIGLLSSNPLTTILGVGARIYGNYADRKTTTIMNDYYASESYQDMATKMDYEYDAYSDYDVYNDGSYNIGPTYTRDDLKTRTVFDAEEHGEPPTSPRGTGNVEAGLGTETMADIQSKERGQSLHGDNGGSGSNQGGSPGSQGPGGSDEMGSF